MAKFRSSARANATKCSSPVRSPFRIVAVLICSLAALAAVRFQQQQQQVALFDVDIDTIGTTTATATPKSKPIFGFEPTFDIEHPVFVLSLPHSADLVIPRYFECAGVEIGNIGKHWTKPNPTHHQGRQPIGQCMLHHLQNEKEQQQPLDCGKFKVWMDLQFIEPPLTKTRHKHNAECFDPVLYGSSAVEASGGGIVVLEKLQQLHPSATILTIQMDPIKWYQNIPKDTKLFWDRFCNPTHNNAFPGITASQAEYVKFYKSYYKRIQDFVHTSAGWEHVVVKWDNENHQRTGEELQEYLGINSNCWTHAVEDNMMIQPVRPESTNDAPKVVPRPADLNFPILVTSLPKSGTSSIHAYFKCGLGNITRHKWTTPSQSTMENPLPNVPIGKCILRNIDDGQTDILNNCGYARVFSDIGFMSKDKDDDTCYYPSLHGTALQSFAKAYPRGTILQVVRDATDWYELVKRWGGNLLEQWASNDQCEGFPPPRSTQEEWEIFYHHHNEHVRLIAKKFPGITYIEIPLSAHTGDMLHNIFGFHPKCWHSNHKLHSDR